MCMIFLYLFTQEYYGIRDRAIKYQSAINIIKTAIFCNNIIKKNENNNNSDIDHTIGSMFK